MKTAKKLNRNGNKINLSLINITEVGNGLVAEIHNPYIIVREWILVKINSHHSIVITQRNKRSRMINNMAVIEITMWCIGYGFWPILMSRFNVKTRTKQMLIQRHTQMKIFVKCSEMIVFWTRFFELTFRTMTWNFLSIFINMLRER
jgi:hypothetical protein